MNVETLYSGYVDLRDGGGIVPVEIYKDGDHIYAYVNGELADDADDAESFVGSYGENLYESLKDYRAANGADSVFDYWPESE